MTSGELKELSTEELFARMATLYLKVNYDTVKRYIRSHAEQDELEMLHSLAMVRNQERSNKGEL
jgi:hypothetical protein